MYIYKYLVISYILSLYYFNAEIIWQVFYRAYQTGRWKLVKIFPWKDNINCAITAL